MSPTALVDRYCLVWNEPDAERRAALLAVVWAERAIYTDPTVRAIGADELLTHIAAVRARRPGAEVLRTSAVETHHGWSRFAWQVRQADGTSLPEGLDIARFSADGSRIETIVGFFGPLPRCRRSIFAQSYGATDHEKTVVVGDGPASHDGFGAGAGH